MKNTFVFLFLLLSMTAVLIVASGPAPSAVKRTLEDELNKGVENGSFKPAGGLLNRSKCIPYSSDSCQGREDGDYLVCLPHCQDGVYITCSNGVTFFRECSTGYLGITPPSNLVYDPDLGQCVYTSPYCPRPVDEYTGN